MHEVVLLMRTKLRPRSIDQVQALLDLGIAVHLVTSAADAVPRDPRFASQLILRPDAGHDEVVAEAAGTARRHDTMVITFSELDIVIAAEANERLGFAWARPEAARISRDKRRQRDFLRTHGVPSVWYCPVHDIRTAVAEGVAHGFPLIVKPTRAAQSIGVQLVEDAEALTAALTSVRDLADAGVSGFADRSPDPWALLEEYIPGREVTLDGVVIGGEFVLGGIHDKLLTQGPFFEEDLYTLPFSSPEREQELAGIATSIVSALGLDISLFNAELREDSSGRFRVVEFSSRISGGHVYRNIRDVYGIDLIALFTRAVLGDAPPGALRGQAVRLEPRMATCAKLLYADGRVLRNSIGDAIFSPYFSSYYPMARPGRVIASAPRGFDILGALSVWLPWQPGQDPGVAHKIALEVAGQLDIDVRDEPAGSDQPEEERP